METYYGLVRSPADAIKLFEACRQGLLPRVQRRLSEKERQAIRSGSVFVWDEREAGMRRWTDGKSWSASRVSGSFLTYREMEGKRGSGFGANKRGAGKTPDSGRGSDEDHDDGEPDGYRYKADGLMKQSFSITTTTGQHLHLISYFARGSAHNELITPSTDASLRNVTPAKGMYPESSLHETTVPPLTRAPMQQTPYGQPPVPPHPVHASHPAYGSPFQQSYWPPSPNATPPYTHSHYSAAPPYPQGSLPLPPPPPPPPPQLQQQQQQQQQHYAPHGHPGHQHPPYPVGPPPQYDRPTLPLPQPSGQPPRHTAPLPPHQPPHHQQSPPHPSQHLQHSPHMNHAPRIPPIDSPRSQQLQAQAREAAAQIDPRMGPGVPHPPQGPLPSLTLAPAPPHYAAQQQPGGVLSQTPPTRTMSLSPRSAHSDSKTTHPTAVSNKVSLSVLLHPTPSNSEPSSANTGSATSSPKAIGNPGGMGAPMEGRLPSSEDNRTLGMLNKKFCA